MTDTAYPGAALGLPERGAGSVARFPRRLVAIFIDWFACTFIVLAALRVPWGGLTGTESLLPLGLFAVENVLLISTAGLTLGHGLLGLRVHRLAALQDGRPGMPGLRTALIRTVLLCLVIPAFIVDRHGRGLHDRVAGTVLLKSR
ncbi:RDD family protein [Ornithinimicrobium cavernae]|uniref:RDD family protein n=1 Tax=Ornithinimicrobium cavernae TaxID=2666047 RepID=UPI001F469A96|nr:RDD family protein [Ornithinimicrobium cavernae]